MKEKIKEGLILSVSAVLTALAVKMFFTEYALTPGGITGLSITLSSLLKISVSTISLLISIPLLIISTFFLGRKFGVKTLWITILIPLFMKILPEIHVVNNPFLAALFGGIFIGISIFLAIQQNCSMGGTDIIAILINRAFGKIEIPTILFILDMIIVLSSWLISQDFITAIYSALSLFVIMQTIKISNKWIHL